MIFLKILQNEKGEKLDQDNINKLFQKKNLFEANEPFWVQK